MTKFTVRVQLQDATAEQYDMLHEMMYSAGYYRFIDGTNGQYSGLWQLPQAEYDHTALASVTQVRDQVSAIADSIAPGAWVFVTEAANRAWRTEVLRVQRAA